MSVLQSSSVSVDTVSVEAVVPNRTPLESRQAIKFHACLNVSVLSKSLEFYSALFGMGPVKAYEDYAKFEIESPPLVLSLKPKRACVGGPLNHLGLRVRSVTEMEAIQARMNSIGARVGRQDDVACCYAQQSKLWITDPDQTLWEVYVFHEDAPDWGEKQNLVKLWKAPLQAFGIRGVIRRWWANAFGATSQSAAPAADSTSGRPLVQGESSSLIPSTCSIVNERLKHNDHE